jgi:hypothetical protein
MSALAPEVATALAEIRRVHGVGLVPLRAGADIMIDGAYYEARPVSEKPADLVHTYCAFCGASYECRGGDAAGKPRLGGPGIIDRHFDLAGCRARLRTPDGGKGEPHVWVYFDPARPELGVFTEGRPLSEGDE